MSGFSGFGKDALPFFKALGFHQSKEWFDANRALYESDVKAPFGLLVEDLSARLASAKVPLKGDAKRSLFRLNRDVRFSNNKEPYKTNAGAVLTRSGMKNDPGLLYIHLDPEGCFAATGFYRPEPPLLDAIRKKMARDPAGYRKLTAALAKGGLAFSDMDGTLTRMPRGYEELKDSPVADGIRRKSFVVRHDLKDREMGSAKLVDTILDFAKRSMPLLRYGWEAAGTEPRE